MKSLLRTSSFLLAASLFILSCTHIDLYEKNVNIPGHQWKSDFRPSFSFTIKDLTVGYRLFFVIRHTEKYNYNNIWINLFSQPPGDSLRKVAYEIKLATDEKGWLGSGMDDIYELRQPLTPGGLFLKPGEYHFSIEQIMREDPLLNVLSVGLRLEKNN